MIFDMVICSTVLSLLYILDQFFGEYDTLLNCSYVILYFEKVFCHMGYTIAPLEQY